jgi:hypothetical protein
MTDRLDDRIRSLMVQVVEASPTAEELEDIMGLRLSAEPDQPVTPLLPRVEQPRRRWLVAVASAVAVLVVVGAAALLFRVIGSDTPVATTPPIDSFSSLSWSRVPYDESTFGGEFKQWMSDVAVGGPGLVAVGQAGPGESLENDRAAVWTSPDGIAWSRVPYDEALSRGTINSVTAGGPGLVAVGWATEEEDRQVAAVWTSVDGIDWSRVPHDEAVFGESVLGVEMSSVTVGGPGLVAVGGEISGQGATSNAVVWTSPDGITWSRVPHNDPIFGRKEMGRCCTSMHSVTAGGPGLVAVGGDWPGDDEGGRAAVWTSVDGITWSRVPHDEALSGGTMSSVTAGGPGLVAVGAEWEEDESVAAVWTSVDGIDWSRVPHDEAIFGGGEGPPGFGAAGMSSVTAAGPGLVAVGSDFMRSATLPNGGWVSVAVVWTSPDGIAWSRVPHDQAAFEAPPRPEVLMNSVTAGGPGLVVVGANTVHDFWATHNDSGESDAAVWVAVPGE